MAVGERIQFFRKLRGMTQKYLGTRVGFPEKSADVRLAQYETGTRTPKADMTAALANILDVSPLALSVPDIDSYLGLMHTLFTLEDRYGLTVKEVDGAPCLCVDPSKWAEMQKNSTVPCVRGGNRRPSWKLAKSPGRNMTAGVIVTRSTTPPVSGQR